MRTVGISEIIEQILAHLVEVYEVTLMSRHQCHFINLNQMSKDLFNDLGDADSAHLTTDDQLHFFSEGADMLAGLVAGKMPSFLKPYLNPDKVAGP